jgi:hypothetical protein
VLGVSREGSAVYFAAAGVLAGNENEHHEKAESGREVANLYEWYQPSEGVAKTTFISGLVNTIGRNGDERDWRDLLAGVYPGLQRSSRLTPDGETLLFASVERLSEYGNAGDCEGVDPCSELYRYRAGAEGGVGSLVCVSCDPDGAPPVSNALLEGASGATLRPNFEAVLTRNLSEDGDRVFFQTADPLLPAVDTNKQTDVYEWEADGEGGCRSDALDDGCLYLISSGTSSEQSYFGDASANGEDVFFFTRQALVPSDTDESVDVYDARACKEGDASCKEPPQTKEGEAVCSGEGCAEATAPVPPLAGPASATFSGSGNHAPPAPTGPPKSLTRAEKLAKALKACRTKRNKGKRERCERQARKAYAAKRARG